MLIKYYNNEELAYANRKRYRSFSFTPFSQEVQKSVLLGDGANTQIKTSRNNICNYVTIDDTRWYVTSYVYMNGGQVTLYLQRDVIGEFGFDNCFGKVERGYTDTFLKYRKELSVNEILKKRNRLYPNTYTYGDYTISAPINSPTAEPHKDELWGIMYITKPTGIDPNTGKPYPDSVNVNIPAFAPKYVNYPLIDNGAQFVESFDGTVVLKFNIRLYLENSARPAINSTYYFSVQISFTYSENNNTWNYNIDNISQISNSDNYFISVNVEGVFSQNSSNANSFINEISSRIASSILNNSNSGITLPEEQTISFETVNYDNITVKSEDNLFYRYTSSTSGRFIYGNTNISSFCNEIIDILTDTTLQYPTSVNKPTIRSVKAIEENFNTNDNFINNYIFENVKTYTRTQLSNEEAGTITITTNEQLVDEPYSILVFPLFDCKITGNGKTYNIQRSYAFMLFNTVIQYLSGENPYLVDAQIYPYCPVLTDVVTELQGYPFFSIMSNTYNHSCEIQLRPYTDVKKEYIKRTYSIVSPEQSGKFDFNFYDYINEFDDDGGYNNTKMTVLIKTALKPFGIVSSAVIQTKSNLAIGSLMGINYDSDLRGCQPTSNGFECSLSTNAFEEYKRQNSNYQQIFKLQQEELKITHETERVNEKTSAVVNTLTATAMGAIGGAALGGGGWTGAVGAATGGATAGAVVGAANAMQIAQNDKLREFEKYLQQQNFDLQIGTIKNLPNSINRISSFNEIILKDFWYVIETYECSSAESDLVDYFIESYGYGIGVFSYISNFYKEGWFIRSTLVTSNFMPNLHEIAAKEFMRGIYIYDKV